MVKKALTDLTIRKLAPKESGRYDAWDTRIPGLGVRVFKSGLKSFFLSYRIDGRRRRATLGRYPEIGLSEARQVAYERRAMIAGGEDPAGESTANALTFGNVVSDFIRLHIERHNKPSTQDIYCMSLRNEFLPTWAHRPLDEIERRDIVALLDGIMARGTPGAANSAYAVINKFFNWCVSRDLLDASPCLGVERPAKLKSRDRVLSDRELAEIMQVAEDTGYPFGTIIWLLALTGQRRGEVSQMEWGQIDWQDRIWHIPATLTKNKRPHSLSLSGPVMDILKDTPRINDQKFVFPARGSTTTSFSGFSKSKRRMDRELGIDDWRLHDLRGTAATGMARLEVPPHVVERVLNHATGQLGGVAGVYNRFQYIDEMRAALERWGSHVLALMTHSKG